MLIVLFIAQAQAIQYENTSSLPERFDLRDYGWITPPKDQMECGSCSAFSALGVIEAQVRIELNDPSFDINLSEQYVLACGYGVSCGGGWENNVLRKIMTHGIIEAKHLPYEGELREEHSFICNETIPSLKIKNYTRIPKDFDEIKKIIVNHGPITAHLSVYEDFEHPYRGGIYKYDWGEFLYAHSVMIIGYNDVEEYWIGKNSWGTDWGEEGFFRISYEEATTKAYLERGAHEEGLLLLGNALYVLGTDINKTPKIETAQIQPYDSEIKLDTNIILLGVTRPGSIKKIKEITANNVSTNKVLLGHTNTVEFSLNTTPEKLGCEDHECVITIKVTDNLDFYTTKNLTINLVAEEEKKSSAQKIIEYIKRILRINS